MSAILLSIVVLLAAAGIAFVNQRSFGRLPRGERLERIRRSPNYRDGQFRNLHPPPQMTSDKGFAGSMWGYSLREQRAPRTGVGASGAETRSAPFGAGGGCVGVVRPFVLSAAIGRDASSGRSCADRQVADVAVLFSPSRVRTSCLRRTCPDIDCLIVTHDHWDHLDYRTVMQLKERIGRVVCPLGVGEHFEYWGFDSDRIVELDWNESCGLSDGFRIHCLPARHFSGARVAAQPFALGLVFGGEPFAAGLSCRRRRLRCALRRDRSPVRADRPGGGGDGQYNADWRYIHLMPEKLPEAIRDLRPARVLTVHHSKFALSRHAWDEPLKNAAEAAAGDGFILLQPMIGEIVPLADTVRRYEAWWRGID